MEYDESLINISLSVEELKLIREALKGVLVRENGMNFKYLNKITHLGNYIEDAIENELSD